MHLKSIFGKVNPFLGIAGMAVAGVLLVTAIFFTVFDLPWIAFLAGVLCAAAIGLVSRLAYAETALSRAQESVRYVDEKLPSMIVYVATDGTVLYHNQAFRQWLRVQQESVNGHLLRDVVGLTIHGQLKPGLDAALAGASRFETRQHEGLGSADTTFLMQYLPHVGARGEIVGAYILQSDITAELEHRAQVAAAAPPGTAAAAPQAVDAPSPAGQEQERRIFVSTMAEEFTEWKDAGEELRRALKDDEFRLYAQRIVPVAAGPAAPPIYEVLLRLRAEEEGLMPPGAFLPLAEEYGLLPDVDRWVVTHVLDWACARPERGRTTCCLNVSAPTLCNPDFTDFVAAQLQARGASGSVLCFEVQQEDALLHPRDAARFVSVLAAAGCHTTLCRFGQSADSFGLLKHLPVDFLKIDGEIILGIERNPVDLVKLKAITRVGKATNRRTIAEFVESDATLAKLRELGVDFAQGFGVDRPRPISELD